MHFSVMQCVQALSCVLEGVCFSTPPPFLTQHLLHFHSLPSVLPSMDVQSSLSHQSDLLILFSIRFSAITFSPRSTFFFLISLTFIHTSTVSPIMYSLFPLFVFLTFISVLRLKTRCNPDAWPYPYHSGDFLLPSYVLASMCTTSLSHF